jgi:prepilin-type N-terminal cleavage/methylation domain-containing protein
MRSSAPSANRYLQPPLSSISYLRSSGAKRPSAISHPPSVLGRGAAHLAPRRSTAFTLIELLVVISIIAVLAALAFPAVNGAINSARKAQARNDVMQIAAAVKAFKAEYGRLPDKSTGEDKEIEDNAELMAILTADKEDNSGLNSKKIVFLEPKVSSSAKGGFFEGTFYDPWGTPYFVKLDTDYDNRIELNGYPDCIGVVIAVSYGPDGKKGPKSSDDIGNYY